MAEIVSFGEWVQKRRNQLGFSRTVLAKQIGCAPITIKKIERDERRPSAEMAELFARHLQVPESELEDFIRKARGEFVPRFGSPEEISLAEAQAPVVADDAPKHNLPTQTTTFVGRKAELAQIETQLADPACRLLTILGAGGMGKTRLEVEAAYAQLENFTDGVTYVSLAPVALASSPDAINPLTGALADALQIALHGGDTPEQQLFAYLRRKEMLIVFDNAEHLIDSAEILSSLLQHAPDVKLLVTSRERLKLQNEWLFVLQGLSFEKRTQDDSVSAIQLFVQRAKQVNIKFDLENEEAGIIRICQLVGGMPLGIELAASWVMQLSCDEIADEIEGELDFLTNDLRDVPDRHRSIRAVFGYSWEKMSAKERDVMQKLSVFRGGFERKAAKAVAGASLSILSKLVGKSLLSVAHNGRYAVHELLRQFAAEKLSRDQGRLDESKQLHSRYFLNYVAEQKASLSGPKIVEGVARINADIENVRTSIQWAAIREPTLFDQTLFWVLWIYYDFNGWFTEMEAVFGMLSTHFSHDCAKPPQGTASTQLSDDCYRWALYNGGLAYGQMRLNRLETAEQTIRASFSLLPSNETPLPWLRAMCHGLLGIITLYNMKPSRAVPLVQQSIKFYELAGDPVLQNGMVVILVMCERALGKFDNAQAHAEASHQALSKMGEHLYDGYILGNLGQIALEKGDLDLSEQYHQASLELRQEIGSQTGVMISLHYLADLARLQGDYNKAITLFRKEIAIARELSHSASLNEAYWALGNLEVDRGNYLEAEQYFHMIKSKRVSASIGGPGWALLGLGRLQEAAQIFLASLQLMLESQANVIGLDALVGLAYVKSRSGEFERALELLFFVQNSSASIWETKEKARKLLEELSAELPKELISEAEAIGRELDLFETAEALLEKLTFQ